MSDNIETIDMSGRPLPAPWDEQCLMDLGNGRKVVCKPNRPVPQGNSFADVIARYLPDDQA